MPRLRAQRADERRGGDAAVLKWARASWSELMADIARRWVSLWGARTSSPLLSWAFMLLGTAVVVGDLGCVYRVGHFIR